MSEDASEQPTPPLDDEPKTARRRSWLVDAGIPLVVIVLAVTLVSFVGGDDDPETTPTEAPDATSVAFSDPESGISLLLPESWTQVPSPDPQVVVVATPNALDSVLVRTADLNVAIDASSIDGARDFTESLVTDGTDIDLVRQAVQIELDGLPGWHYLYRFTDEASGEVGIHSHYFLFDGDRMIVLVFQALPLGSFESLAPTFDDIAMSLRIERRS